MGTAGSNAPVVFNNEGGGRGESFWIAKYDDVIAATLRAGEAKQAVQNVDPHLCEPLIFDKWLSRWCF
jgi:hypothetical protein